LSGEGRPVSWLNPAGGLRYHLRGLRHAKSLWWPFRFALAEWLYAWQPPERRLVVVGPSAGYCLEPLTLERFDELVCLEPDPVARFLFARRLRRAPLERRPRLRFETRDLLLGDPSRFAAFLAELGDAAVLFSNFLGQLRVLLELNGPDPRLDRVKRGIVSALAGRSWASFHDRVSGTLIPDGTEPFDVERRLSDAELIDAFFDTHRHENEERVLIGPNGDQPLLDHLTEGLFPADRPHRYFVWELDPGHYHLIEATSHVVTGA
jgi:hypothetical protein